MIAISNFLFENVICIFPPSGEDSSKTHQKVTATVSFKVFNHGIYTKVSTIIYSKDVTVYLKDVTVTYMDTK